MTVRRFDAWSMRGAVLAAALLTVHPSTHLVAQDTIPAGFGTLRRDDIAVRFTTGTVEIQVLPLNEQVIRLLAPDTHLSLLQLIQGQREELEEAARRNGTDSSTLVMVTFFGLVPQARFNPEDLSITSHGRLFRPIGIVPLSPTWGSYQLEARQQAVAIYLFDPDINFRETLSVSYQGMASEAWSRALRLLEQERARVRARAQAVPPPP
jgi:hypothetical protein